MLLLARCLGSGSVSLSPLRHGREPKREASVRTPQRGSSVLTGMEGSVWLGPLLPHTHSCPLPRGRWFHFSAGWKFWVLSG